MVGRLRSPRGRIAPRAGPTPAPRLLSRALFFGAPPRSRAVGRAELSERCRRPLRWSRMAATDAQRPGCVRRRVSRLSGDVDIADFASRVVQGAAERRVCRSGLIAANLQLICLKRSSPCSPRRGRGGGPRRPTDSQKGKKVLGGKPVLCVYVCPPTRLLRRPPPPFPPQRTRKAALFTTRTFLRKPAGGCVSPRTSSWGRGSVEWSVSSFSTKRPRELLRTVSTLRITRTLKKQKHSRGH